MNRFSFISIKFTVVDKHDAHNTVISQQERLREALESAQMGSNRIENACTAARFLINSLSNISQQVDPNTNHRYFLVYCYCFCH